MVKAAPVRLAAQHLKKARGKARAILVNAGNANCATPTADQVAQESCRSVARAGHWPIEQVLPCSTGVIGVDLDVRLLTAAVPDLFAGLAKDRFHDVTRAIMTTDLAPKAASGEVPLRDGTVRIAGMTKGSGMIQPNMATTLGFVLTDAAVSPVHLRGMLGRAIARSYNRLSVDGDTSTNDTVILLANGASGVEPNEKERLVLEEVLCWVMEDLAEKIAQDGEGARKLIRIRVTGARTDGEAEQLARSIANSPLVKTAIAGSDPNWGRILCAAGYSGVKFDPAKVDIKLQGEWVCRGGLATGINEAMLKQRLDEPECHIRFAIQGRGKGMAQFWTCDLTEGYVRINGSYRT
jgi:glutamate N-acetyltransferase/amino-acid N-acetyltransferase